MYSYHVNMPTLRITWITGIGIFARHIPDNAIIIDFTIMGFKLHFGWRELHYSPVLSE